MFHHPSFNYFALVNMGPTLNIIVTIVIALISSVFGLFTPNYRYKPLEPKWHLPFDKITEKSTLLELDLSLAFCKNINLREVTIVQLQDALIKGQITSLDLVRCYKRRIEAMDPHLNSILEVNPDLEAIAQELDKLRSKGVFYGPLHGIPILLKDNIGTFDRMETTAGSIALLGIKPKEDAEVVRKLKKAGAIILGKANLSEFANFRGDNMPNGWSGRGNRTRNAYVLSADSSGSSSGSAVAVAANLVPAALGSETDGSIVSPASKASLVGLKTTIGRISTVGVIPLAATQDVLGPMARTVSDAAILFSAMSKNGFQERCYNSVAILNNCLQKKFVVGVLRDPNWTSENVTDQLPKLEEILTVLRNIGVTVIDPVVASNGTLSSVTSFSEEIVLLHGFKADLNSYLKNQVANNEVRARNSVKRIRNLADIIEFNKLFPAPEGYDQNVLIRAQATDGLLNNTYIAERDKNRIAAQMYLNYIFQKYSLDAIIVPTTDSSSIPAVAGYPHITVPAGINSTNIPFGVSFFGLPDSDESLLILAFKLETHFKARKTSKFLS